MGLQPLKNGPEGSALGRVQGREWVGGVVVENTGTKRRTPYESTCPTVDGDGLLTAGAGRRVGEILLVLVSTMLSVETVLLELELVLLLA